MNPDQRDQTAEEMKEQLTYYYVRLDEIYLFPEQEHDGLIQKMVKEGGAFAQAIHQHFKARRPMGEWLKILWARRLVPTRHSFHEITPIIARVRFGAATKREQKWLGERITTAIKLDDHDFLKVVFKLVTKTIVETQSLQINRAAMEFYEEHERIPSGKELHNYVRQAKGEKHKRFQSLDEDNWKRYIRRSGLSSLFKVSGQV